MSDPVKELVYSRNTVEFVTVSVQYCAFIEQLESSTTTELSDTLTKLLPLLYLKALLVPETDTVTDDEPETTVTEGDYNYISSKLYGVFGANDTYLEVFLQDMKYSETPIAASISEDLADIYQDLKNFITIYERGVTENMNDALSLCSDNFKSYWGQKLVNVLRALHSLRFAPDDEYSDDEEEDSQITETDDLW